MAAPYRVVMFDQRMYHGNGLVIRWARLLVHHFGENARLYAPVRSGELRRGISVSASSTGPRQVEGTITSNAPHSIFVIRGTYDGIQTTRAWADPTGGHDPATGRWLPGYVMRLRPGGGFAGGFAYSVRGQQPNNFMFKAWRRTARSHSSIKGVLPNF